MAVIASGPSLTESDVNYLHGKCKVIAVNDNYKLAPWANILYACDAKWWDWHHPEFKSFFGMKYTQSVDAAKKYGINYIEGVDGEGLSTSPYYIHTNQNSGAQAINLAYLLGAKQIILLGFDMQPDVDGKTHWFGEHPDRVQANYKAFLRRFDLISAQKQVDIINCTRKSALKCFPRKSLISTLC